MASQALDAVVSHWAILLENFQTSPLAFYQAVEAAVGRREVPQAENTRADYREAGLLSAHREYLHISREKLSFDICGAPFGSAFFVSWWLTDDLPKLNPVVKAIFLVGLLFSFLLTATVIPIIGAFIYLGFLVGGLACVAALAGNGQFDDGIVRALPIVGRLYTWLFKPSTFYRVDTMQMFQQAVHNAVLEVIDAMTAEKGIRALTESERKPIMHEFYGRKR